MVQINFALKEVNCKIVYYGPGMSGKTTNLEVVHQKAPPTAKGELTSIATEGDRTLFFDFLPLDLGQVAGMRTKFQLYTVPGQVYYNATRKLVLQGADGIIFVADTQVGKMEENLESLKNLEDNLAEYRMSLSTMPFVMQYNKRDLPNVMPVPELEPKLNPGNVPYFEASAITGEGVFPTLKKLASMVLESLNKDSKSKVPAGARPAAAPAGRPGVPGARPPQPGMRPPQPGARPPQPAARAPQPGVRPPQPGARPPQPGMRPPQPGARPPQPGMRPPQPGARPPQPGMRPPQPGMRPPQPGARPPQPGARPPQPGARPPQPGARPPQPGPPGARPPQPGPPGAQPAARPPTTRREQQQAFQQAMQEKKKGCGKKAVFVLLFIALAYEAPVIIERLLAHLLQ